MNKRIYGLAVGVALTLFFWVLSALAENLILSLILFTAMSLYFFFSQDDREFTNPVSVFSIFFYLYSTWHAFHVFSTVGYSNDPVLRDSINLSLGGLLGFSLGSLIVSICFRKLQRKYTKESMEGVIGSAWTPNVVLGLSLAFVLLSVFYAAGSGYASKRAILESANIFLQFSGYIIFVVTAGMAILLIRGARQTGFWHALFDFRVMLTISVLVVGMLVLGERDFVFRAVFIIIAIYGISRSSITPAKIFLTISLLIFFLPLSSLLKAYFLTDVSIMDLRYSLDVVFSSEFNSASRNTYMILHYNAPKDASFFFNDVIRALTPFGSGAGMQSSAAWYNSVFRDIHGFAGVAGWGFSLLGQGYIIGGELGVVFIFLVISIILNYIYLIRFKSVYWCVLYLFALVALIYSIRADLANFLSQSIKIGGVAVLCFYIMNSFLKRRKY